LDAKEAFKILQIDETDNEEKIKSAYRALAKQFHPDINHDPEAVQKFKEITEAYNFLTKPVPQTVFDRNFYKRTMDPFLNLNFTGFGSGPVNFDLGGLNEMFGEGRIHVPPPMEDYIMLDLRGFLPGTAQHILEILKTNGIEIKKYSIHNSNR
jgi:DnaJ-class molecular chaperone